MQIGSPAHDREGGHWLEVTLQRILDGGGMHSDIDMLVSVSHQMTGLNLCPLGDSIEPFLASVVKRFESQFRAYIATPSVANGLERMAISV